MADNTWIVYCSDHGEMLGDHMMCNKVVYYDASLRVPCIIRPPGGVKGWKSNALTDQLDVTATLLEMAGAEPLTESDGRSLLPQVIAGPGEADAQKGKEVIFSDVVGSAMVYDGRYKLAINVDNRQPVELIDQEEDPEENNNFVNDPAYEKVRNELMDRHVDRLDKKLDVDRFRRFQEVSLQALGAL